MTGLPQVLEVCLDSTICCGHAHDGCIHRCANVLTFNAIGFILLIIKYVPSFHFEAMVYRIYDNKYLHELSNDSNHYRHIIILNRSYSSVQLWQTL